MNLAHVEGIVTLDDKPVADAGIVFLPSDPTMGPPASGTTDAQGKYTLVTSNQPGAAVGEHRVAISKESTETIPQRVGFPQYKTTYGIPPKYAVAETSGLVATIVDDDNRQDFSLTTK